MRRHVCYLFMAATLVMFSASKASARNYEEVDPTRIYGGLWLGFGGNADGQFGGHYDSTLGGQFGFDAVVSRFVSLGAEARIGASKWEKLRDRSKLIDLDFKPRLRLPLRGTPIELYIAVPVGLTIPRLSDAVDPGTNLGNGKAGWNFGVGPGINLFLGDTFGINAEPIWMFHKFKDDAHHEYTLKQFSILLNLVLAL